MQKKFIIPVFLVGIIALIAFLLWRQSENVVMEVNGEKIGKEEFAFYLDFYEREIQKKENEEGKQAAQKFIAEKKIEQQMAFEMGVSESFEFEKLKAQMEEKNAENQDKKQRGKPVYGLLKYNLDQFYGYRYNNAVLKMKEELAKGELKITDSEKRAYYEENKETLFTEHSGGTYIVIEGEDTEETKNRMEILRRVEESGRQSALAGETVLKTEVMEVTNEKLRELEKAGNGIAQQMLQIEQNTFSEVIKEGKRYRMVYCQRKGEGEVMRFDEVEKAIQNRIVDIKYQKYLEEKIKDAKIK